MGSVSKLGKVKAVAVERGRKTEEKYPVVLYLSKHCAMHSVP
nr:hypothetical protein [Tanacetum cinerariifolium]